MADEEANVEQENEELLDFTEGVEGEEAAVAAEEAEQAAEEEAAAEGAENGTEVNGTDAALSADDPMAQPPHGTEVFVGGVPRTATEEQLKALASEIGEVHGITLLREPQNPQQNRGFGFIKYKTVAAANAALEQLGGKEMADFPGQALRVAPSQSKHKLYVGNIPKELNKDTMKEEVSKVAKGVESVDLLMSKDFPGQNRGFAFVEFYNHACAQAAKNALSAPDYKMGGRTLNVAYAEPKQTEQQAQQQPQAQPKVIYVGNLPNSANETNLKELFDTFSGGEVTKVVIPPAKPDKPNREFGFIHFAEKETVDKLIADAAQGTKPELDGKTLEIKAAKPQVFPDQQQGFGGGRSGGFGGGRGFGGPRGRGGFVPRGRGRGGFGGRGGAYTDYNQQGGYGGYDEWGGGGYGGYDEGYSQDTYMGYGGYDDYSGGGYEGFGGAAGAAGMAMVPMMLPNGQVGYVLQGGAAGGAGGYGGGPSPGGPMRSGGRGGGYSGRGLGGPRGGRGRGGFGGRRYQPY